MNAGYFFAYTKRLLILLPLVLLIILLAGFGFTFIADAKNNASDSIRVHQDADLVLKEYLENLAAQRIENLGSEEAQWKIQLQEAFGENFTANLNLIAIDGPPPLTEEFYRIKSTGERIDKESYDEILFTHVEKICLEQDLNPQYLSYIEDDLLALSVADTVKRNLVLQEIANTNPLEVLTESIAPFQYYLLEFSGYLRSIDGMTENYRVVMINQNDIWEIYALYYDTVNLPDRR